MSGKESKSKALNTHDAGDFVIGVSERPSASSAAPKAATSQPGPSFGVPSKLEPFVLLGKNARGASAANLISQATSAVGVFVFSELLQLQGIKELAANEQHAPSHQLLEVFAYGTWSDYASKRDTLPKLNHNQATKLKQLTILSLAMDNRVIPYSVLLSTLDLPDVPALEDLLIDSFYSNVLSGRLDQKESRLEVVTGIGRDVRPALAIADEAMDLDATDATASTSTAIPSWTGTAHSVGTLTRALTAWLGTIQSLLQTLDLQLASLAEKDASAARGLAAHESELQKVLLEVSTAKDKEKDKDKKERGGGGESNWIGSGAAGLKNIPGSSGANQKDDMDVDGPAGSAPGRGLKSPSGPGARTRKRGRM